MHEGAEPRKIEDSEALAKGMMGLQCRDDGRRLRGEDLLNNCEADQFAVRNVEIDVLALACQQNGKRCFQTTAVAWFQGIS